ncbi:hypothetical protein L6452_06696 [Arctium lappa]|uniref:Uncharacterized protein n=1 Tax=Arctium lappa TaxID=4217 RepID=A0ACB9EK83_ARCLA|nr:hypothetical protein L6452_06696 [Arctium lappa]
MLSIIDLSSVHGTWVSGKRIESGVPVKLKEGDTVRMGGSSRIYELHWVPLSQAYDVDDPFIPAVYAFKQGCKEETKQDENCLCPSDDDLESLNLQKLNPLTSLYCSNYCSDDTEVEHSSPSNGNGEIFRTSLVQPSPFLLETMSAIEDSDSQNELENQSNWMGDKTSDEFEQHSNGTIKEDLFSVPNCSSSFRDDMEVEWSSPWKTGNESGEIVATESNWSGDKTSDEFEQLSNGTIKEDSFSVRNCSSSFWDDMEVERSIPWKMGNESGEIFATFSVQAPLVVSETISATETSDDNLNKSEDEASMKDDLVSTFPVQAPLMVSETISATETSDDNLNKSEDEASMKDDLVSTFPVQAPLVVSETISATESSDDNLNKSEDESSMKDDLVSTFSVQAPLMVSETISTTEISDDNLNKSEDESSMKDDLVSTFSVQVPLVVSETISATEISDDNINKSEDESSVKDNLVSVAFFDAIMHGKDALDQDIARGNAIDKGSEHERVNQQKTENSPVPMALFDGVNRDENGFFSPLRAESEEVSVGCDFEQMNQTKTMDESASLVLFDGVGSKVDDDVICKSIMSRGEEVDMVVELELFDHDTPKKDSVLVSLPDGIHMDQERTFTPDKSRTKEVYINPEAMHSVSVSVNLFDSLDGNELEIFTPGKENSNPNACSVKSLKSRWKEDEHEQSNHCMMSKKAVNPADNEEKDIFRISKKLFTTDGEKFVSDTLLQRSPDTIMKMEGSYNSIDYPQTVQNVVDTSHNILGVAKKRWTMVVDTNSLLHNESLKHLKLLQGLIGTQLFVPKIVIRGLMDIKCQDDILKKCTKKVSLALKWIDECMVDTKWWIRMDDETLHSSEAEYEVLETALHLRKEITDRKIIILSNDLTLKIKAMAEGVMCETAEEFRRSLVNPFSERFMWVGSSARGPTWSCVDDDVLRQKYHGCTLNASHRLKGLKLLAHIKNFW